MHDFYIGRKDVQKMEMDLTKAPWLDYSNEKATRHVDHPHQQYKVCAHVHLWLQRLWLSLRLVPCLNPLCCWSLALTVFQRQMRGLTLEFGIHPSGRPVGDYRCPLTGTERKKAGFFYLAQLKKEGTDELVSNLSCYSRVARP